MARFQETVDIQPVDPRTGAPQALLSLADRLESFKNQQIQIAGARAVERGVASAQDAQLEKKEGVTQQPKFKKKKFIGGIEIDAHNKALRSAYLASLNSDIRAGVSRIKAENPDNLVAFNEAVSGFSNGIINSVDQSVKNIVAGSINEKVMTARIVVQAADIKKQNNIAFQELKLSAQDTFDNALLSARKGDIRQSANELVDLASIYDAQVESGFITEPQATELKREAELRATQESLVGSIRSLTDAGKFKEALTAVEKARSKAPKGMSIEEHSDLITAMTSDINESISLRNKIEDAEKEQVKATQLTSFNDSFIGILEGTTNANDIIRQIRNNKLTEPQATKLINILNNRGQGIDDWPLIGSIQEDIRSGVNPDAIRTEIISNTGSRLTGQTATELISSLNQSLDKESVLNTSEVKRARDFIIPSIRVTGPLGALDTQAERRLAGAIREFDTRVLAGENPWLVADELVGKDAFDRAPNPRFGTKDNLEQAQELLNQALLSETINDDDYNFEAELIKRLTTLKTNIDVFDKNKKEALSGPR